MNPPHSTRRRTQTRLDPLKEAAWGARPRTVSQAALLGVRLNDRRPAPICMGGCAAQGVGLGGPSPVAHTPGLGDCPPPPARPSRALACKQGVLGLRGEVGWWGEGSNPTPGPPPGYGPKARSASFGGGGQEGAVMGTPVVCATCSDLGWDLTGRCKVSDLITRALLTDGSGQLLLDVTRRHGLCAEARAS